MDAYQQRIRAIHKRLTIPDNYADQYGLPLYKEAENLVDIGNDIANRPRQLTPIANKQWHAMQTDAATDGITLQVVSAYRSVDYQCEIIQRKLDQGQSIEQILSVSAAPGHSEHHTGRALDLTTPDYPPLEEIFEESEAFKWLCENAARYTFSLSYPKDPNSKVAYEPWHWACLE